MLATPLRAAHTPRPPQYISYQTIVLAVVGSILSVSAAVALSGYASELLLEPRRAKRIP